MARFWFMATYTATLLVFGVVVYLWKVRPARLAREADAAEQEQDDWVKRRCEAAWTAARAGNALCPRCRLRLVSRVGSSMCEWCGI